jgi:hypothetical protein
MRDSKIRVLMIGGDQHHLIIGTSISLVVVDCDGGTLWLSTLQRSLKWASNKFDKNIIYSILQFLSINEFVTKQLPHLLRYRSISEQFLFRSQ